MSNEYRSLCLSRIENKRYFNFEIKPSNLYSITKITYYRKFKDLLETNAPVSNKTSSSSGSENS